VSQWFSLVFKGFLLYLIVVRICSKRTLAASEPNKQCCLIISTITIHYKMSLVAFNLQFKLPLHVQLAAPTNASPVSTPCAFVRMASKTRSQYGTGCSSETGPAQKCLCGDHCFNHLFATPTRNC
jgi:hypothetical protein